MDLNPFGKRKTPAPQKTQSHQDSLPIFRHTRLLVGVLIVILVLLVGIFLIAGYSYRRYHSDTSAWLLFGVLMVIVVVMAPLFWGSHIGLAFGPNGLHVGNGAIGGTKKEENQPTRTSSQRNIRKRTKAIASGTATTGKKKNPRKPSTSP